MTWLASDGMAEADMAAVDDNDLQRERDKRMRTERERERVRE